MYFRVIKRALTYVILVSFIGDLFGCDSLLFDENDCESNQECQSGFACIINPYNTDEEGNPLGECTALAQCSCDYENEVCVEPEASSPICKILYTDRIAGEFCHTSSVCKSEICAPDLMNFDDEESSLICVEAASDCLDECTEDQRCVGSDYSENGLISVCITPIP